MSNDEQSGGGFALMEIPARYKRFGWGVVVAVTMYTLMMAGCKIAKAKMGAALFYLLVGVIGMGVILAFIWWHS